jgi:molecular chaperone IbpA
MNDFNIGKIAFGPGFDKLFVGFDDQFNRMHTMHEELKKNIPNYPPYNIKKTGENTYIVELAVAGFAIEDISIEIADGKLVVTGNVKQNDDQEESFIFKGISNRAFTRSFILDDQIEVRDAEMFNGMLQIFLERIIPDHKKPKKIEVKTASRQTLLTE